MLRTNTQPVCSKQLCELSCLLKSTWKALKHNDVAQRKTLRPGAFVRRGLKTNSVCTQHQEQRLTPHISRDTTKTRAWPQHRKLQHQPSVPAEKQPNKLARPLILISLTGRETAASYHTSTRTLSAGSIAAAAARIHQTPPFGTHAVTAVSAEIMAGSCCHEPQTNGFATGRAAANVVHCRSGWLRARHQLVGRAAP